MEVDESELEEFLNLYPDISEPPIEFKGI